MKKKITVGTVIALVFLTAVAVFNVTYIAIWNSFNDRLVNLNAREAAFAKLSEIAAYVDEYFIDDYSDETLLDSAARGYVGSLPGDASYYLSRRDQEVISNVRRVGYVGVGIISHYDSAERGIRVFGMYDGSTALTGGIKTLDLIMKIDGAEVYALGYEMAMEAIRGPEGSTVDLQVYRDSTGETLDFTVRRGAVITEPKLEYSMRDGNIGYIKVSNFDKGMDAKFVNALKALSDQGAKAFIIDLRINPGGYMDVMANMLDPLMDEGVLYQVVDKTDEIAEVKTSPRVYDLPVAIIVNRYTISAAEYFAEILRETGNAVIVGEKTPGNGYAQQRLTLSDGSALVISALEYRTPEGVNLEGVGVLPDIQVTLSHEKFYSLERQGLMNDPQFLAARRAVMKMIKEP